MSAAIYFGGRIEEGYVLGRIRLVEKKGYLTASSHLLVARLKVF